jgi:hypothetical protein
MTTYFARNLRSGKVHELDVLTCEKGSTRMVDTTADPHGDSEAVELADDSSRSVADVLSDEFELVEPIDDEGKLVKGITYRTGSLAFAGWSGGSGEGLDAWAYFETYGTYKGPDADGVEPLFTERPSYTIRVPGQSAWATASTLDEAEAELEIANRTAQPGHKLFALGCTGEVREVVRA